MEKKKRSRFTAEYGAVTVRLIEEGCKAELRPRTRLELYSLTITRVTFPLNQYTVRSPDEL